MLTESMTITAPWQMTEILCKTPSSNLKHGTCLGLNRKFEKTSPEQLSEKLFLYIGIILSLSRSIRKLHVCYLFWLLPSPSLSFNDSSDRWQRMHAMKPHLLKCWSRAIGMCLGGSSCHESADVIYILQFVDWSCNSYELYMCIYIYMHAISVCFYISKFNI